MKNLALTGGVSLQFMLRLTYLLLALMPHIERAPEIRTVC